MILRLGAQFRLRKKEGKRLYVRGVLNWMDANGMKNTETDETVNQAQSQVSCILKGEYTPNIQNGAQ